MNNGGFFINQVSRSRENVYIKLTKLSCISFEAIMDFRKINHIEFSDHRIRDSFVRCAEKIESCKDPLVMPDQFPYHLCTAVKFNKYFERKRACIKYQYSRQYIDGKCFKILKSYYIEVGTLFAPTDEILDEHMIHEMVHAIAMFHFNEFGHGKLFLDIGKNFGVMHYDDKKYDLSNHYRWKATCACGYTRFFMSKPSYMYWQHNQCKNTNHGGTMIVERIQRDKNCIAPQEMYV